MQVILIKENQKEIWNEFITENGSESFLQAWEWGNFNRALGRKVWRIGVVEDFKHTPSASQSTPLKKGINKINSKLIAVALILKNDLPFGRSYFYCPRGPVISQKSIKSKVHKVKSLDFLFSEIKKIAKREKSLFLKIDPPIGVNQELRT
ncbi:peptidoglycan bridge formation glycyltransferase FemA/FemB family protein, partial [Candidatus Parcubacteria bacterium]|nr:peptidoglycan bridge formation glycyltransferase FemA/FemB family protein [Candidatus Parcubacteria bacterium]